MQVSWRDRVGGSRRAACLVGSGFAGSGRGLCIRVRHGDREESKLATISHLSIYVVATLSGALPHSAILAPSIRKEIRNVILLLHRHKPLLSRPAGSQVSLQFSIKSPNRTRLQPVRSKSRFTNFLEWLWF